MLQVKKKEKKKGKIGYESREKIAIDALENAAWRSGSTFTHELANKRAIRCDPLPRRGRGPEI